MQSFFKFNRQVVTILYNEELNEKQKLAQLQFLIISHEDDLSSNFTNVLEKFVFTPQIITDNIVCEKVNNIPVRYSLN